MVCQRRRGRIPMRRAEGAHKGKKWKSVPHADAQAKAGASVECDQSSVIGLRRLYRLCRSIGRRGIGAEDGGHPLPRSDVVARAATTSTVAAMQTASSSTSSCSVIPCSAANGPSPSWGQPRTPALLHIALCDGRLRLREVQSHDVQPIPHGQASAERQAVLAVQIEHRPRQPVN